VKAYLFTSGPLKEQRQLTRGYKGCPQRRSLNILRWALKVRWRCDIRLFVQNFVSFFGGRRAAIVVFDLNGYSLWTGQHPIELGGSGLNDLQQDFTNSSGLFGTQFKLPTLRQAQLRPAYAASLSQLKLGQVSHSPQFFEIH